MPSGKAKDCKSFIPQFESGCRLHENGSVLIIKFFCLLLIIYANFYLLLIIFIYDYNLLSMITLEQMLNSSVHLGHNIQKWNPKMAPYIYGERNGIHIIDLLQTLICLEKACRFLSKMSSESKDFDLNLFLKKSSNLVFLFRKIY